MKRGQHIKKLILMLAIISLIGCQPRSDSDFVHQNDSLEDAASASEQLSRYTVPTAFQFSASEIISDVETDIVIDAKITIPGVEKYPIYKVRPNKLSKEQVNAFIQGSFANNPVYSDVTDEGMTKQMYVTRMQEYQTLLADAHAWEITAQKYADLIEYYQTDLQQRIKACETAYANASEKIIGTERPADAFSDNMLLFADLGGVKPATVSFNQTVPINSYLTFDKGHRIGYPLFQAEQKHMEKFHNNQDLMLSEDAAKEIADKFLKDCGITQMVCSESGIDSWFRTDTDVTVFNFKPIYTFVYTPVINGIGMAYVDINYLSETTNWNQQHPEGLMNQIWYQNSLHVFVDDSGVQSVTWRNPVGIMVEDTVAENPELLPFDSIMDRFLGQIKIMPLFYSNNIMDPAFDKPEKQTLNITRIELSYTCILSGAQADSYILVPVWDFFGHMEEEYENARENRTETTLGRSYLTINAVDGSIIDRIAGY